MSFRPFSKVDQLGGKKKKSKKNRLFPKKKEITSEYLNDLNVTGEAELFDLIFELRDPVSFLSGQPIKSKEAHGIRYFGQFAHVLSKGKGKYYKFRYYSKNIVLLTNREHLLLDAGTEAQRDQYATEYGCDWSILFELKNNLITEYKKHIENDSIDTW